MLQTHSPAFGTALALLLTTPEQFKLQVLDVSFHENPGLQLQTPLVDRPLLIAPGTREQFSVHVPGTGVAAQMK